MTAHAAELFTLNEVNRIKTIQDVVDRRLITHLRGRIHSGVVPGQDEGAYVCLRRSYALGRNQIPG